MPCLSPTWGLRHHRGPNDSIDREHLESRWPNNYVRLSLIQQFFDTANASPNDNANFSALLVFNMCRGGWGAGGRGVVAASGTPEAGSAIYFQFFHH